MSGARPTRDLEIFETPDPTPNAFTYEDDRHSEVVHSLDANIKSSFKRFKNTSLDPKSADFSDALGRPRQCGYQAEPSEYGIQPVAREPETLMQRYQRLKTEVVELATDVQEVSEAQQSSDKMLDVSPVDLAQDVDLKSQVEAIGCGDRGVASGSHGNQPIYELYAKTETAKFSHLSKLSEVEERLAQLEGVVGNADMKVCSTVGGLDADQNDLSTAVLNLQAKVALLDSGHISAIAEQLQEVLTLLGSVDKKSEEGEKDADRQTKVSEALEAVSRMKSIAPLIPDLISRLHALRDLHERAAQFASSVAVMADSQDQLTKQTEHLQSLLTEMEASFKENLATVQANFANLEARFDAVKA
ncbi:Dynactin subunit 2 [Geodia barretti]|uniref:Dynactin subunit 2 n=1 Tax=Geodia barretti TaxID=519541 RepID=A0AA35RKE0_GEOBA|nr:Dynactin subunit 2 [Geodia barretti]